MYIQYMVPFTMYIYVKQLVYKGPVELTLTAAHSWMVRSPRLLETYRRLRLSRSNSGQ